MNDLDTKRNFMVSINHKHGHNTKQHVVSGRCGSCPRQLAMGCYRTLAHQLLSCSQPQTWTRVLCLGLQSRQGHATGWLLPWVKGKEASVGPCGRKVFVLNGMYFTHFWCPMDHLHPDVHPICVWSGRPVPPAVRSWHSSWVLHWWQQTVFWMCLLYPLGICQEL